MAEIILDFIQCHFCEKRFEPDDPLANEHWKECPNSPTREMKALLLKIRDELPTEYWSIRVVTLVSEIDALLGEGENG